MAGGQRIGRVARHLTAGFALFALLLQVLVPQGFMVARQDDRAAIVICDGHGPAMSLADPGSQTPKSPAQKSDPACAFALHGVALTAPLARVLVPAIVWRASSGPVLFTPALTPGRGLAAPPPPSQAPPFILS